MTVNIVPLTTPAQELINTKTGLVYYDAMCRAIAEAYTVDEVKEIRDKTIAIEQYAKLAKNYEAERQACEIRLRAERRMGQLLREMEKLKGRPEKASRDVRLSDLGVSYNQASKWQKLAKIDDADFDAAVVKPKATTAGIIAAHTKPKHPIDCISKDALWVHGTLKDFRRNEILSLDPATICETMLPHMRDDMRELVPLVIAWLERINP